MWELIRKAETGVSGGTKLYCGRSMETSIAHISVPEAYSLMVEVLVVLWVNITSAGGFYICEMDNSNSLRCTSSG